MKPRMKAKWIKALESGKYQKGFFALRKSDTFCCLGVLCDLHDSTKWGRQMNRFYYSVDNYLSSTSLPYPLYKQYEITYDEINDLMKINDERSSVTFEPVIEYIKKNM